MDESPKFVSSTGFTFTNEAAKNKHERTMSGIHARFRMRRRRGGWKYPFGKNYRAFRAHWYAIIMSRALKWD